jgi:hypothetical protein
MGRTICALADAAAMPVRSFIKHFQGEFEYHIQNKKCLVRGRAARRQRLLQGRGSVMVEIEIDGRTLRSKTAAP